MYIKYCTLPFQLGQAVQYNQLIVNKLLYKQREFKKDEFPFLDFYSNL